MFLGYLGGGSTRWELLCGHDVSAADFWARRGFTSADVDQAQAVAQGGIAVCAGIGTDQVGAVDIDAILGGCGWPGSDSDPGPRTACLDAFVGGGEAAPPPGRTVTVSAMPALLPSLPSVPGLPRSVGGIPTTWLLIGGLGGLVLLYVVTR